VKIVIVGCGRVGAVIAESLDHDGHEVLILDHSTRAFDRLPSDFGGQAIRGDGTDEDVLRRAGAVGADVLLALTEGDNRNVMAAQVAVENLAIPKAMAKVNDPVRAAAYAELGISTICRTTMLSDAIEGFLGLPRSGVPSVIPAVGGGHQHEPRQAPAFGAEPIGRAEPDRGSSAGAGTTGREG
jgi:trk system potassium uptake protein TrkA